MTLTVQKSASPFDIVWRTAYRFGFPMARIWWRLSDRPHDGALVAIWVDQSLLLLRSSYRTAWNFPGGAVRPGETPEAAARRELVEEINLSPVEPLTQAGEAVGRWEGRQNRVFLFTMRLATLPPLCLDNREIIGAQLTPLTEIGNLEVTGPVRAYLDVACRP